MTIAKNWFPLLPLQVKVLQMRLIFSSRIMTLMFCRVSLTNTQLIYYPWSHFKTWHNFNFMPFVCIGLSVLYVTMLSLFIFNLRNFKLFLNKKDCKIVFLNLYSKYLRSMIITIFFKSIDHTFEALQWIPLNYYHICLFPTFFHNMYVELYLCISYGL